MKQYLDLIRQIRNEGIPSDDRTGTGTLSIFGAQMRFNLQDGFPLVTTKKTYYTGMIDELLFFIKGGNYNKEKFYNDGHMFPLNVNELPERTQQWWRPWADKDGNLGPIYGAQWRHWRHTPTEDSWDKESLYKDQLQTVINNIKSNPYSRRHIVSAWNVGDLVEMRLEPCHIMFQFYVRAGKLSCQMFQRSGDMFLGVPMNIASYSLLTHMVAQVCDLEVGDFVHTLGDAHIYMNHLDQVDLQLTREPLPLPKLELNPDIKCIDDFKFEDIKIVDYKSHGKIKAPLAV